MGFPLLIHKQTSTATTSQREQSGGLKVKIPWRFEVIFNPYHFETIELLRLLGNWNPLLRRGAARALADRGEEVLAVLLKASAAESRLVRAGSTEAIVSILRGKGKGEISDDYSKYVDRMIALTTDPDRGVRASAFHGLRTLAPGNPEAVEAVLELIGDEDVYLAEGVIKVVANGGFALSAVKEDTLVSALKVALTNPLLRGRGDIVKKIATMDERIQRKLIPDLLGHLDWKPMRDVMFGASNRKEAIQILTKLKVQALVPRLPALSGQHYMGGYSLFDASLDAAKAFGRDAKVILPELKAMLARREEYVKGKKDSRVEKLKATIASIEQS